MNAVGARRGGPGGEVPVMPLVEGRGAGAAGRVVPIAM